MILCVMCIINDINDNNVMCVLVMWNDYYY